MTAIKRFVSDTIIYGFTTIASRLLNFLLTPIFIDRLKNASAFGMLINMYAWMSMLNAILAFGMETTFFRYQQKVKPAEKGKVYSQAFLITLVTSLLVSSALYMFRESIAHWLGGGVASDDYAIYIQLLIGVLVADALAVVPFAKLRADGRPIRYGALKMINILVNIGANLIFLFLFPKLIVESDAARKVLTPWFDPDWVLGNIILANLIASFTTLLLLMPQLRTIRLQADRALLRSMLGYSFPILIANISFIINEHLDKMMFPHLFPGDVSHQDDLGVYGAVSRLAVFIALFVTAFRLGAEPFFFAYAKNENAKKTYADIMFYFVLFLMIGLLGISANLDWLKYFINKSGDPEQQAIYWSGLVIVPVLLFNYVLLGIYMNLSIWYKLTDQTRFGLYISVIGALATVLLNIILIPKYSYVGAALSTTMTYFIMVGLSYFWGQKYYPIPYEVRKISLYLIFGLAIAFAMQHLLDSHFWWSNGLLILCLMVIGYAERPLMIKLWKTVVARRSRT